MKDAPPEPGTPRRLSSDELRDRKTDRRAFDQTPRTPIALVLDGVSGPYNQGAVCRLADGFLLEKLHFCGALFSDFNRRFKKAARGTTRWVPYTVDERATEVVAAYRERGYQIVVAELAEGSVPVWQAELRAPMCLVLGAELNGVSDDVMALADVVVEFPTLGMANSLNISMSAAMLVLSAFSALETATRRASTP